MPEDPVPALRDDVAMDSAGLEEVLRRAVEIEHRDGARSSPQFSVDDAVRVAAEIGVSEGAVRYALVQVERDALLTPATKTTAVDRWFGARTYVSARNVPGPAEKVRRIIGQILTDQLFRVSRNMGDRVIWERSESLFDGLRRAFDFTKAYTLPEVDAIDVMVQDSAVQGRVDVRIELDLSLARQKSLKSAVIWPTFVGAGFLAIGASMIGGAPIVGLVFASTGAATGAGMHARIRGKFQKAALDSLQNIERLLDFLEHEA